MNTHLKQLWAAMKLPKNFKKSYKFFCLGLDIRVTNIVDSDTRDSSLFGTSIHLPVEITLGNGEHSVICSNSVEHFEVILNFLCQKLRHSNDTITLFGFWSGDQILPIQPLVRLIDGDSALLKIKICRGQSQKFCFCQYKSKKNLLLIRKKHHCFHPVMLLRTILFRLCFFFFVENVIHLPAYLHTTWFINKDFLNNL